MGIGNFHHKIRIISLLQWDAMSVVPLMEAQWSPLHPRVRTASAWQSPYVLRFAFAFETPIELLVITEASPVLVSMICGDTCITGSAKKHAILINSYHVSLLHPFASLCYSLQLENQIKWSFGCGQSASGYSAVPCVSPRVPDAMPCQWCQC